MFFGKQVSIFFYLHSMTLFRLSVGYRLIAYFSFAFRLFDSVAKSCMQRKEGGGGGPAVVPSQGGSGIPSGGTLSLPHSAAAASAVNVSSSTASASGVGPAGSTGGGSGTNAAGGAVQSTNVTLACPPAAASSTQQVRNDQVVSPSSANIIQAVTVNNSEGHSNSG